MCHGLLIHEVSRAHNDAPQSGRLFWMSDQLVAEASQETNIHAPGGIRTHNPSKRAAADPRLTRRGHWDRLSYPIGKRQISPITVPRCPEGSRTLRFPDYVTVAQDCGKVVSLTQRPHFTPRKYSWYSFLLEAESTPGP